MGAPKGHAAYNVNGEGGCPPTYTVEFLDKLADKLDIWIKDEKNIWIKDFLNDNYLDCDLADVFNKRSKRFRLAHKHAMSIQESRIFKRALERRYDGTMARFGLMNNHGWSEKSKTEISGNADNPLNVLFNHSKDLVKDDTTEA